MMPSKTSNSKFAQKPFETMMRPKAACLRPRKISRNPVTSPTSRFNTMSVRGTKIAHVARPGMHVRSWLVARHPSRSEFWVWFGLVSEPIMQHRKPKRHRSGFRPHSAMLSSCTLWGGRQLNACRHRPIMPSYSSCSRGLFVC